MEGKDSNLTVVWAGSHLATSLSLGVLATTFVRMYACCVHPLYH